MNSPFLVIIFSILVLVILIFLFWYFRIYKKFKIKGLAFNKGILEKSGVPVSFSFNSSNYSDSTVLQNARKLLDAIGTMDNDNLLENINKENKSFSKVIQDAIKDPELAKKFKKILEGYLSHKRFTKRSLEKLKEDMLKVIKNRIKKLEKVEIRKTKKKEDYNQLETKREPLGEELRNSSSKDLLSKEEEPNLQKQQESNIHDVKKKLNEIGFFSRGEIKNLNDLLNSLMKIDETKFNQFLNENKTAFEDWLKEILEDLPVLKRINQAISRQALIEIIREELVKSLYNEHSELKGKISALRKKGKDPIMAEIKLMNVPPKIKMVEVTYNEKDVKKVKELLDDVRKEISNLEKEVQLEEKKLKKENEFFREENVNDDEPKPEGSDIKPKVEEDGH